MSYLGISLALGAVAGLANLLGGAIVGARAWSRTFLSYSIAVGSGFMLATALTEMVPESLRLAPFRAPLLILAGYFIVHVFEHSWPAHFHFGEETHPDAFLNVRIAYTALGGLVIHTFFDGVAIASGFMISTWLGTVIFGATLLHNVPEGFTMASIMTVAHRRRSAGLWAVTALGVSRIVGILVMASVHRLVSVGLAVSGGVTLYVAASDLIPEVNKTHGVRAALAVGAGVGLVILLRLLFLGHAAP
ncbi:MAG TPA: ZIP family metal transporter [Terriglobia bacterium]|nr:ZIP family metal transporter [Terriglobia bacterium]